MAGENSASDCASVSSGRDGCRHARVTRAKSQFFRPRENSRPTEGRHERCTTYTRADIVSLLDSLADMHESRGNSCRSAQADKSRHGADTRNKPGNEALRSLPAGSHTSAVGRGATPCARRQAMDMPRGQRRPPTSFSIKPSLLLGVTSGSRQAIARTLSAILKMRVHA